MRAKLPLALLAALPFATTVGCVADSSTQGVDEIASALEQDNGGLDTTDEAPMFAAETAFDAAQIETDTVEADPMAADPTIVEMARPGSAVAARDLIVMCGRRTGVGRCGERERSDGEQRGSSAAQAEFRESVHGSSKGRPEGSDDERPATHGRGCEPTSNDGRASVQHGCLRWGFCSWRARRAVARDIHGACAGSWLRSWWRSSPWQGCRSWPGQRSPGVAIRGRRLLRVSPSCRSTLARCSSCPMQGSTSDGRSSGPRR